MGWIASWPLAALVLQVVTAGSVLCPKTPHCVCGAGFEVELDCTIDGRRVEINYLPNTYLNIKCINATSLDFTKLPKCGHQMDSLKSVSFKDCPLPSSSFEEVLTNMGVSKTMALILQNSKNTSSYFDRKHFLGMQNLTKLLLSINGITHLPDNIFSDINKLTWLNIRSNSINLSQELFKPLKKLETLEISHNHMSNISRNLFSHLSNLRKLSLWQSNATRLSNDFFSGVDALEELDLSSIGLNEMPPSIFKPLKKLKKLTLFFNKFSSLPQNLFKSNDALEAVTILNNDVTMRELPENLFGNLSKLKQVYIRRCGLRKIPYNVFANSSQVTNISLTMNEINVMPELIFNDQINLLELDMSHNKLQILKPKLFSSLVRLEKLDLSYNSLVKISGTIFAPLLSLLNLNMEHNKLKFISSCVFSYNRQIMSVSLAYNHLDFENKELFNNTWEVKQNSPFAKTYNLRLLNLSHNKFTHTYQDWWMNGHDILDISFNSIAYLWDNQKTSLKFEYKPEFKRPLKEVWISHNNFQCRRTNNEFIELLLNDMRTKIKDLADIDCPFVANRTSDVSITVAVVIVSIFGVFITILNVLFIDIKKYVYAPLKNKLYSLSNQESSPSNLQVIVVEYSEKDEDFVCNEVLPALRQLLDFQIYLNVITKGEVPTLKTTRIKKSNTTLVIFSPNYLTSNYSHISVKKIQGEMLKTRNTIYLFADIGPENSIYAFLKEQRKRGSTVLCTGQEFWNNFLPILGSNHKKIGRWNKIVKSAKAKQALKHFTPRSPESMNISTLGELPYMQV